MTFYQILRIYIDSAEHNSVQFFYSKNYESVDALLVAVQARYHNILAADLQNSAIKYNAAYIIGNNGEIIEKAIFDRGLSIEEEEVTPE